MSQSAVERAALDLLEIARPLDIVRWESAPPELRANIDRFGIVIEPDVT
jgi:hypothetical protein